MGVVMKGGEARGGDDEMRRWRTVKRRREAGTDEAAQAGEHALAVADEATIDIVSNINDGAPGCLRAASRRDSERCFADSDARKSTAAAAPTMPS